MRFTPGWKKQNTKIAIDNDKKARYNLPTYVLPVEEEEYAKLSIREGRSQAERRPGRCMRNVALEGCR